MNRMDQFDRPIPNDLVITPNIEFLGDEEIKLVDGADWYDANGILLVSAKAIEFLSESSLEDATGKSLDEVEDILHISPALHRWNYEDGFYHA